jgi:hypothetical protein
MSSFRYTPLENPGSDLRLVTIHHGQHDESLECTLITQHDAPIGYQALSYAWGDKARKLPISLNGQLFSVTPNLESALRSLRCATEEATENQLPLWIDAICINQEDGDERDEQVRRMKSVYQQAVHVIIWLGNYNEPCDEALRFDSRTWELVRVERNSEAIARSAMELIVLLMLERIVQEKGSDTALRVVLEENIDLPSELEDFLDPESLQIWAQLSRLFNRPWFERLWIIQELAVAKRAAVAWGEICIPWPTLENAAKFILRPGITSLPTHIRKIFPVLGAHRITQVALRSMINVDTKNILTLLHNTQNTKCSDPRDRLYAILGIVKDIKDIEVDYSIPVQQVYRNWAEKRIRRTRTLDILSACADSGRFGDLPSWVPDLRRLFGQDKVLWNLSQGSWKKTLLELMAYNLHVKKADAWKTSFRNLHFSDNGLKLYLLGKPFGSICRLTIIGDIVTGLPDPTDLEAKLRQILGDWHNELSTKREPGRDESSHLIGFKASILRSFEYGVSDSEYLNETYDRWKQGGSHWKDETGFRSFEQTLFPRVHGCQMFTTKSGRVGIVAGNCKTQIGDELWLLSGGLTAFLLRRINEVEHRLISPCYTWMMFNSSANALLKQVVLI